MNSRLQFIFNRLNERLWVRPLLVCVFSIAVTFAAKLIDLTDWGGLVPDVTKDSITTLLTTLSSSMLVIATFAVSSMVSAYASASTTATPRSFALVISDDASQNALSTFIGTFIFSIVALIALLNSYYDQGGRFALFVLTIVSFAVVILTFVNWLDRIARLGRVGHTIDLVEKATADALTTWHQSPYLGGNRLQQPSQEGLDIIAQEIGYLQRIEMKELMACAEQSDLIIHITCLPGSFCTPDRPVARIVNASQVEQDCLDQLSKAFIIGGSRTFDEDPRFGLIALSEIATRALSPGVNDPGTAISVIGTLVRLLSICGKPIDENDIQVHYSKIYVPDLVMEDLFEDAFMAIGRCGADSMEVGLHLQKALGALAQLGPDTLQTAAKQQSRLALQRAKKVLDIESEYQQIKEAAQFSE